MSLHRQFKRQQAKTEHKQMLHQVQKAEAELAQERRKVEALSFMLGWNHAMHAYDCRGGTTWVRLTGSPLFAYADALEATITAKCYQLRLP